MNPLYPAIAKRANHRCEYCLTPQRFQNTAHEVEHIVPKSQGGGDEFHELALACRTCNGHKSDRQTGIDDSGSFATLFNPRKDTWSAHFQWDLESGRVIGLTPCGQATVRVLNLNSVYQIQARLLWIRMGLFPEKEQQ